MYNVSMKSGVVHRSELVCYVCIMCSIDECHQGGNVSATDAHHWPQSVYIGDSGTVWRETG